MYPRWFDSKRTEKAFESELNNLLRFTNHIRPALVLEEDVQRFEPNLGASDVICGKVRVAHLQAASVQYGCP